MELTEQFATQKPLLWEAFYSLHQAEDLWLPRRFCCNMSCPFGSTALEKAHGASLSSLEKQQVRQSKARPHPSPSVAAL